MRRSGVVRSAAVIAASMSVALAGVAGAAMPHGDQRSRTLHRGSPATKVRPAPQARGAQATPTTWDSDPAVASRTDALLAQMTNAEKADLATGQINNFYGFYNNPIARLGIPAQTMADGPVGVRVANPFIDRRTTRFSSGTGMGATFDPDLIRQVGQAIGNEGFHRPQRPARPDRRHPAHAAVGPRVRGQRRGPAADRPDRRAVHR